MTTRWGQKLGELCAQHAMSLVQLGSKAGCSHALLSRYISGRLSRPTADILRSVGECWGRADRVDLVAEHLHDEIERAGLLDSEIRLEKRAASDEPTRLDRTIDRLATLAENRPAVQNLLSDLVIVLEGAVDRGEYGNGSRLKIADNRTGKYTMSKAKK